MTPFSFARLLSIAVLFASLHTAAAFAQPHAPSLPAAFVQVADPVAALRQLSRTDGPSPVGVRVSGRVESDESRAQLTTLVAAAAAANVPVWLAVEAPATDAAAISWRQGLRAVLTGGRPAILELTFSGQATKLAAYVLQLAATEAGVAGPVTLAFGGDMPLATVYTAAMSPYVDAVVVASEKEVPALARHLDAVDPGTPVLVVSPQAPALAEPFQDVTNTILRTVATPVVSHAWSLPAESVDAVVRAVAGLQRVLMGEVTEIDPGASSLELSLGEQDVTGSVRHRLLFDNKTFATMLVYWGEQGPEPLVVQLVVSVPSVPVIYDVIGGTKSRAEGFEHDEGSATTRARLPLTGRPMLVDFTEEAPEAFADRSGVSAVRLLTADEIIARHRRQQARQDAVVENYIALARLQQHFRPTVTDPGYDVVTDNRYFVDREGVEWEELSFSVNGSKWGADRPPFPLLQPEKVLSLPLQMRFDEDYRYALEGMGDTDGYRCYLIRFEPVRNDKSLYRGTLWIDSRTFAAVRVRAVQTNLTAPVVSNEEVQVYRPVATVADVPVFLLSNLTARQIVLIAGRNLLLEKVATFSGFQVNGSSFGVERESARGSERVMYRETDRGLRYFVKKGETRVVADQATMSAKAMAIGVTVDPSYSFPLPIFGINYLDFEFGNPQTQLAVLFAGVLAAGNVQRPRLAQSPIDASVDFFAIAVPSSDRLYTAEGERSAEALLTWPLTSGANLGWQYTPFQKLGVQYQFRFDGFIRDRETAETFVPPPSTTTHGVGTSWEYRRGGYSVVVNGLWNTRLGWREWGDPARPEVSSATYAKYSAIVSRDFVLGPFQKVHADAAWFGGKRLDRLSRYQFGLFDTTRIHGVPSSGLRFDDLLMARGGYSFNIFEQYRFDLFLEQAWGRDKTLGSDRQRITGIGAAVNVRAPWQTILRADVGKAFLPDRYRGLGSVVVQIMVLKPIR